MSLSDLVLLTKDMVKPLAIGSTKLLHTAITNPLSSIVAIHDVMKKPRNVTEGTLPYEIPLFTPDMKYCNSKEPYLRPTYAIQSNAPEIIALANSLGAFQKSDRDYILTAFEWVRDNIALRFVPDLSALDTLRAGRAHCMGKTGLLAALCRCGGLPCRVKVNPIGVEERTISLMGADFSQEVRVFYEALFGMIENIWPHNLLEIKIDGEWIPTDPVFEPEIACALGYPIATMGADPSNLGFAAKETGKFYYIESYPALFVDAFKFLLMLGPGLCYAVNESLKRAAQQGKEILKNSGGIESYNKRFKNVYEETSRELTSIMEKLMKE